MAVVVGEGRDEETPFVLFSRTPARLMVSPVSSFLSTFSPSPRWASPASLLGLLFIVWTVPGPATAQTPTTTIQNSADATRLQLNYDGGFYVPGTFLDDGTEADSIPTSGAGTRMMWYPAKAAIRAGRAGVISGKEDVWDADSVGTYSTAFGVDTKAAGLAAFATGGVTSATGTAAIAMGSNTIATAEAAVALGERTKASASNATALGINTTANGPSATALGRRTTASGIRSTAMGFGTIASGENATAFGRDVTASGTEALAAGRDASASGNQATALGFGAVAATKASLAIGNGNWANDSADSTLFVAGNGVTSPTDALVLDYDGNLEISGTLTESSDRRLKTDIEPLGDDVLSALQEIRPVRYRFKNNTAHPSGEQIGLIAQNVRKEFPSLVNSGSNGMLSLTYSKFTTVLLKGLQEQQSQIADLKAENEALQHRHEQRIAALETRLNQMSSETRASMLTNLPGSGLLLGLLVGSLFGAGLLWRRRS